MGMLTGKPRFAEQIIERYFRNDLYYFDDSSLVFYRERMRAGGGASSAYNTELTLKLLLMFQNYRQSGQSLNINWNMINNAVMKTASGMSYRMEQSIREIFSRSETRLKAREAGVERLQSVILDLLYRNRIQERGGQPELKIIGSIGRERLRIRLSRSREENIRTEHITGWLKSLEGHEAARIYEALAWAAPRLYRQMRDSGRRTVEEGKSREAAQQARRQAGQRESLILMAQENQGEFLLLVKKALRKSIGSHGNMADLSNLPGDVVEADTDGSFRMGKTADSEREKALDRETVLGREKDPDRAMRTLAVLFRKYEEQIFTDELHFVMEQNEDKRVKRQIFNYIEAMVDLIDIRPETAGAVGRELLDLLRHNYRPEGNAFPISGEDRKILELSENAIRVFRENPQALGRLRGLIDRVDKIHRERLRVWGESRFDSVRSESRFSNVWGESRSGILNMAFREITGPAAEQRPLSTRVATIIESRFSEPGLAKQAEKELFDILIHDLSMEEYQLIWKKEEQQEFKQGEALREQKEIRRFFSSRENVELLRKKIESTSEVHLERLKDWVNRYQNILSEQKERSRLKETKKLISESQTELALRLLQSEKRLERERQELVIQVGRTLGEDAARQLEQYFNRKNRVAGKELQGQAEMRTDETVKNIINAYIGVTSKEDAITRLNPGGYIHLENRMREEVHDSGSEAAGRTRYNLDILTAMMRRDYDFNQEQSRFFLFLSEQTEETAQTLLLRHETGERKRMAKEALRKSRGEAERALRARNLERLPLFRIRGAEQKSLLHLQSWMQILPPAYSFPVHLETVQNSFSNEWGEAKTEFLRRQSTQEMEITETRTTVRKLNEKMELQEKLVAELKKQPRQESAPPLNVDLLTKQIMKKMESELRLEKMRRGLL